MEICIEREGDLVTVKVSDSTMTQTATFDRSKWIFACGCVAELLEKILERDCSIKMYQEVVAKLKRGKQ